jgi:aspartyl-tRNA synthetase
MNKFKIRSLDTGGITSIVDTGELEPEYYSELNGWRDAIEVSSKPVINTNQRIQTNYDLSTSPVEVSYNVIEKTVQEHQKELTIFIGQQYAHALTTELCNQFIDHTTPFNDTVAANTKLKFNATIEQLLLLSTFEELDQFLANLLPLTI